MTLRIDMQMFSHKVRQVREDWEMWQDTYDSYREYLAAELKGQAHLWQPAPARTEENLRDELVAASIRAGECGASREQIEHIIALSKGDFSRVGYSILSRAQASNLINDLKKEG